MRIKESPSGKYLTYCVYQKADGCIDKGVTLESAQKAARTFDIDIMRISTSCCEKCYAVLSAEMDEYEKNLDSEEEQ